MGCSSACWRPSRCCRRSRQSGATAVASRPNDVQFVMTSVFLGLGIGQVLYGPLSDRIGCKAAICRRRRPVHGRVRGIRIRVHVPSDSRGVRPSGDRGYGTLRRDCRSCMIQCEGARLAHLMSMALAVYILVPTVVSALGQVIRR